MEVSSLIAKLFLRACEESIRGGKVYEGLAIVEVEADQIVEGDVANR